MLVTGRDALTVTINGEVENTQLSGIPGTYVLGPNSINGKSHWLQESDSNAIWYNQGNGWGGWFIGSQENIINNIALIISFGGVVSPQEVSTWYYYNGSSYIISDDILVDSGTCIHHTKHTKVLTTDLCSCQ